MKEAELKECLIADLLDKRRHAELEKNTMEVGGGGWRLFDGHGLLLHYDRRAGAKTS